MSLPNTYLLLYLHVCSKYWRYTGRILVTSDSPDCNVWFTEIISHRIWQWNISVDPFITKTQSAWHGIKMSAKLNNFKSTNLSVLKDAWYPGVIWKACLRVFTMWRDSQQQINCLAVRCAVQRMKIRGKYSN